VQEYVNRHKYHMQTYGEYEAAVKAAGFSDVKVQDITPQVRECCVTLAAPAAQHMGQVLFTKPREGQSLCCC
jgi:hypothetical protein